MTIIVFDITFVERFFEYIHMIVVIAVFFQGPKGENIGAITQPLPYSYLIFRAPSEAAG